MNAHPILKNYVYFDAVADGVYFRGGSETLYIRGRGIYPLVRKVLSDLDGKRSVEQVIAALPAQTRDFAGKLVEQLTAKRMLQPADSLDAVGQDLQRLYGDTIAYLREHVERYGQAFLQWRAQPMTVLGGGYSLKASVRALARSGVRDLAVCLEPVGAARPAADEIDAVLRAHAELDPEFRYRFLDGATVQAALADTGRVPLYVCDRISLTNSLLAQALAAGRTDVVTAGVLDGRALVGPDPRSGSATLADLTERLAPAAAAPIPYSPVTLSVLGNLVALEMMAIAAGVRRGKGEGRLSDRFLYLKGNGEITLHGLAPVPTVTPRQPMSRAVLSAEPAVDTEFARLSAGLRGLFDPVAGVFEHVANHELTNIPLFHAVVRSRLPNGLGGASYTAIGWGISQDQADCRALLAAAQHYARATAAAFGWPGSADIVVEADAQRWRETALAHALARSPAFADQGQRHVLTPAGIGDMAVLTLLRVLKLFSSSTPRLALDTLPGAPVYRATVTLDEHEASVVAAHAVDALELALGQIVSALQTGAAPAAQEQGAVPLVAAELDLQGGSLEHAFPANSGALGTLIEVVEMPYVADPTLAAGPLVMGSISVRER